MADLKGFHTARGPLRAINHAEGQLSRNHKQYLLFAGLDILSRLSASDNSEELSKACPNVFRTGLRLRDYADSSDWRGAMFSWDLERSLREVREALITLRDYCHTQFIEKDRKEFRSLQMLTDAAASYFQMAHDVANPETGARIGYTARTNPVISAAFVAEYMNCIAETMEGSRHRENKIYETMAAQMREMRFKIYNNLPDVQMPLYEMGPGRVGKAYHLMSLMSAASDLTQRVQRAAHNFGENDTRLTQGLGALFQISAVYDWEQYETRQAGVRPPPPPDNLLRFQAR